MISRGMLAAMGLIGLESLLSKMTSCDRHPNLTFCGSTLGLGESLPYTTPNYVEVLLKISGQFIPLPFTWVFAWLEQLCVYSGAISTRPTRSRGEPVLVITEPSAQL
jgi:hypothetical protein